MQKGIGKFGVGPPNASIPQCSKLEVWTRRDGKRFYTFLDVEQIEKGGLKEIPGAKRISGRGLPARAEQVGLELHLDQFAHHGVPQLILVVCRQVGQRQE